MPNSSLQDGGFKTSLFGFRREDVLSMIEAMSTENLQKEADTQVMLADLKSKLQAVSNNYNDLLEKAHQISDQLAEEQKHGKDLQQQLDDAEDQQIYSKEVIETLKVELEKSGNANSELQQQLEQAKAAMDPELPKQLEALRQQQAQWQQERATWEQKQADWEQKQTGWEQKQTDWEQKQTGWEQQQTQWQQERVTWEQKQADWEQQQAQWQRERATWEQKQADWEQQRAVWQQDKQNAEQARAGEANARVESLETEKAAWLMERRQMQERTAMLEERLRQAEERRMAVAMTEEDARKTANLTIRKMVEDARLRIEAAESLARREQDTRNAQMQQNAHSLVVGVAVLQDRLKRMDDRVADAVQELAHCTGSLHAALEQTQQDVAQLGGQLTYPGTPTKAAPQTAAGTPYLQEPAVQSTQDWTEVLNRLLDK